MRFTSINVDDIEFADYEKKSIKVQATQFQIPRMYMPFGISGFTPAYGATKYNIDFSMKGWDQEDNYVKKFYDFLKTIEDRVVDKVFESSKAIFGNQLTRNEILDCFNSNIKPANGPYDPKFRVKIDDHTNIYNINDAIINTELTDGLYKGFSGAALIEMGNIYFFNKKFGIVWKISQIKVYEQQRVHGFAFEDGIEHDEDDDHLDGFQFNI